MTKSHLLYEGIQISWVLQAHIIFNLALFFEAKLTFDSSFGTEYEFCHLQVEVYNVKFSSQRKPALLGSGYLNVRIQEIFGQPCALAVQ